MNLNKDITPVKTLQKKVICDEMLRRFLTLLSERDCWAARILYQTDITISELLKLKVCDINNLKLSTEIMLDLNLFCIYKKPNDLIFTNKKGKMVQRSHFSQAFSRASRNMKCSYSLKPGDLTQWKLIADKRT